MDGIGAQLMRKCVSRNPSGGGAMGCRYRLELHLPGYESQAAEGEFTDNDTAILEMFLGQQAAIAASPILSAAWSCSVEVSWDENGARVETDIPDPDTIGLLLHRMRPFILQSEPASFVVVSSLVGRQVDMQPVRDLLARLRRDYDGRSFRGTIAIDINEVALNSERTLTKWLNSHEYHRDPEKREDIQQLLDAFPGELARGVFVCMLIEKKRACSNLARLVALLLNKRESLGFTSSSDLFSALDGSD